MAFGGCEPPSTPRGGTTPPTATQQDGEPQAGDWIVSAVDAEPPGLNPLLSTNDATGSYIASFIMETLLKMDNETMEFKPHIAKSWEISEDHLSYTFHLRDDVTFSDGVPLTADDLKFTYDVVLNPANDTANIRNYIQDIETVEIIDPFTIRYVTKRPYFRHLIVLGSMEILPKHIYGNGDFNTHPNNRHPVGTGPYKFDSWVTGQQIVLVRNENYWGTPAPLDKRVFKIITDDNAAFQVLERHETDYMRVPPTIWTTRASRPAFEKEFDKFTPDSPIPGFTSRFNYVGWNTRKPQFSDKRVRRALAMLFDRQLIIDEVWAGLGTLITASIFHKAPEYNQDVQPWPFDPERAKELLDEAGWVDTDRDGVRDKDGVKFEFELSYAATIPEYDQLGTVYQEELKRAGIKVNLGPLEWATFQERVHKRTFDACMLAWLTTIAPDPYQLWHSSQAENGSNYPGFNNAEADQILQDAREEFDHDKRIKMYHRFHEILHEEQPYIFLYARPGLIAVDKRFSGVNLYPAGLDPLEWWVPKNLQRYQ